MTSARKNSAHYRAVLEHFSAEELGPARALETLRSLPLLQKATLRESFSSIVAGSRQKDWVHGHTSGTTGSPLEIWYDRATCYATNAADRLQKRVVGVEDSQVIGMLLGRQVIPRRVTKPPFWVENRVQHQVWYSSLHLSPATIPAYVADMRTRRLTVLEGYPSTLYIVARHLLESGQRLPLGAVFSSSETLHRVQREAIEEAFQAKLYDYYGHAERVIFAIECSHGSKHVVEPFGITEVVDPQGNVVADGEQGLLVGTSLFNLATPMLRYQTSDVSAIDRSPCACGIGFGRIRDIATKAEDMVILPDGRWMSPSALTHPFKPFNAIKKSQVIQEALDRITILVVADDEFTVEQERELVSRMADRVGAAVVIDLKRVDDIPREKSGKFRWVISRVPSSLRVQWT